MNGKRGALCVALTMVCLACGCHRNISVYQATGPSSERLHLGLTGTDSIWADEGELVVCVNGTWDSVTGPLGSDEERRQMVKEVWRSLNYWLVARANYPEFRTLCGLLNSGFGSWRRLVVLELLPDADRIGLSCGVYGFVLLAVGPHGMKGVTNLSGHFCEPSNRLRLLAVDDARVQEWLGEMDRIRQRLPPAVVWDTKAIDTPLTVLYDFTAEGGAWKCAVYPCGDFPMQLFEEHAWLPREVASDAEVAAIFAKSPEGSTVNGAQEWNDVILRKKPAEVDAPASSGKAAPARQLRQRLFANVFKRYLSLVEAFWVATMGRPEVPDVELRSRVRGGFRRQP